MQSKSALSLVRKTLSLSRHLRVLLQDHASTAPPRTQSATGTFNAVQSIFHENTAVHTQDSIVESVCGRGASYKNCDVLRV